MRYSAMRRYLAQVPSVSTSGTPRQLWRSRRNRQFKRKPVRENWRGVRFPTFAKRYLAGISRNCLLESYLNLMKQQIVDFFI